MVRSGPKSKGRVIDCVTEPLNRPIEIGSSRVHEEKVVETFRFLSADSTAQLHNRLRGLCFSARTVPSDECRLAQLGGRRAAIFCGRIPPELWDRTATIRIHRAGGRPGLGDSSGAKRGSRLRLRSSRSACRHIRICWFIFHASRVAHAWLAQAAAFHREWCGTSCERVKQRIRPDFPCHRAHVFFVEKKLGGSVETDRSNGFCCRELLQSARRGRT